jgi:hypothetical protein
MARESGRTASELVEHFRATGRVDELRAHLRHRHVKEALRGKASVVEEAPTRAAAAPEASAEEKPKGKGRKKG